MEDVLGCHINEVVLLALWAAVDIWGRTILCCVGLDCGMFGVPGPWLPRCQEALPSNRCNWASTFSNCDLESFTPVLAPSSFPFLVEIRLPLVPTCWMQVTVYGLWVYRQILENCPQNIIQRNLMFTYGPVSVHASWCAVRCKETQSGSLLKDGWACKNDCGENHWSLCTGWWLQQEIITFSTVCNI